MLSLRGSVCCSTALILLACGGDSPSPAASRISGPASSLDASGPSASGHGSLIQPSGALRTFSFHARVMPDGSVQGTYDNHNRQGGFMNHGDIDCIRFIGTNGAVMSGIVQRSTNPAFPAGVVAIFRVEDNGEGANDAPDRVSQLVPAPVGSNNCMTFTPVLLEIVGGNVQVRP